MNNTTAPRGNHYEIYKKRRSDLLAATRQQAGVIKDLKIDTQPINDTTLGGALDGIASRLTTDEFGMLNVGRFSAGKSTFLNALFGQAVLPSSPSPTTGVLCEISYAPPGQERFILYPKEGMGPDGGSEPLERKDFKSLAELSAELQKHVRINHREGSDLTSRYKMCKIFWPLPICENGVKIIDSVGLDDPDARDEITMGHADKADAIVFCMSGVQAYSDKDKQVLTSLKARGHRSIFFVVTFYDMIKQSVSDGQSTEEELRDTVKKNVSPWTDLGEKGIYYVDSRSALHGKIDADPSKVEGSGILSVEQGLEDFLVNQKGKAKLVSTLLSLRNVNRAARKVIPARIGMLQTSMEELETRYRNAQMPLQVLEAQRQLIVNKVGIVITDIGRQAHSLAECYFAELPGKLQGWADAYEFQNGVGFPPRKSTIELVAKELIDHLRSRIEGDIGAWNESKLTPMIQEYLQEMHKSVEAAAREFMDAVEKVRVEISVGETVSGKQVADESGPSTLGRLVAGGYALATGDFITGGAGMVLGIKALINTIVCQVVAGVLLVVFHLLNPVGIILAVIASILGGSFLNVFSLKAAIKKQVVQKIREELLARRKDLAKTVETKVIEKLNGMKEKIDQGLSAEIEGVRAEVEKVREERSSGAVDTKQEIARLSDIEQRNNQLEERLEAFLQEAGIK